MQPKRRRRGDFCGLLVGSGQSTSYPTLSLFVQDMMGLILVAADYGEMTRLLLEHVSRQSSQKKPAVVLGLEGGYQLRDGVAGGNSSDALTSTLRALKCKWQLCAQDGFLVKSIKYLD